MTDLIVERRDRVAVLTLSDPARRNALTNDLSDRLQHAVSECDRDESLGAIVITGAPPAFCAGGDLGALEDAGRTGSTGDLRRIYDGFLAVANCELPTIAAVNGPAVGAGLNLALSCDLRLAGPGARFDPRFLQLGIHPGGGMTWMAHRLLGPQTTAALALFGDALDADKALRTGLVYRLVELTEGTDPRGEAAHRTVVDEAVRLAARAAAAPRDLVVTTKRSMRDTSAMTEHAAAVDREVTPQVESLASEAFAAAIAAARRKPSQ